MPTPFLEFPADWTDYQLIDSGEGGKLERFGPPANGFIIARPDPRALWRKSLPQSEWNKAEALYERDNDTNGQWKSKRNPPDNWSVSYHDLVFTLRSTEFKHVGVFPEQAVNWLWLKNTINGRPLSILNLFAYTGGATLAAVKAGARVTHVDSVKSAITWAHNNARASAIDNPQTRGLIRWIQDDAYKFVLREAKRGNVYDGVIMDPPRFGRGLKGEVWKIENDLPKLLIACRSILSSKPALFLINAYTADLSSLVLHHLLIDTMKEYQGVITYGELALKESIGGRLLPSGICARWSTSRQRR